MWTERPAAIQELKLKLQNQCPPLATTTLEQEIGQIEKNEKQTEEVANKLGDAILELAKQVREHA